MKRLLIVDDDDTTLFALKKLFSTPDVAVMIADNKEDALTELHGDSYDAVITDLRLTGTSGEEGLDILRYVKKHSPATKVILITGYGNSDVRRRAIQEGADYYFEKPISADKIRNALICLCIIMKNDKPNHERGAQWLKLENASPLPTTRGGRVKRRPV